MDSHLELEKVDTWRCAIDLNKVYTSWYNICDLCLPWKKCLFQRNERWIQIDFFFQVMRTMEKIYLFKLFNYLNAPTLLFYFIMNSIYAPCSLWSSPYHCMLKQQWGSFLNLSSVPNAFKYCRTSWLQPSRRQAAERDWSSFRKSMLNTEYLCNTSFKK